jgi:hypothetical protein
MSSGGRRCGAKLSPRCAAPLERRSVL